MSSTRSPPPPLPSSSRPRSPPSAALSKSSTRSLLLRIPNARASRLRHEDEQWQFLALGDLSVYQVGQLGDGKSAKRPPPPVPSKLGEGSGSIPSASVANSAPTLPPRLASPRPSAPAPAPMPITVSQPGGLSPNHPSSSAGIVLAVRNTEFPLAPTFTVEFEQPNTYILDNGQGFIVKLELETSRSGSHEILDNILRRYSARGNSFPDTPDSSGASTPELHPQDYKNQLLLFDESSGKVVGQLNQSMPITEGHHVSGTESPGRMSSSDPVLVSLSSGEDGSITDQPVQVSAFEDLKRNYGKSNSRIVGAAEFISQGFLTAAEYGANSVNSAAKSYTERSKPTDSPLAFSDTTKQSVAKVTSATETAAKFSKMTVGFIASKAEQVGGAAVKYGSKELETMGLIDNSPAAQAKRTRDRDTGFRGLFRNTVQAGLLLAEGVEKGGKHFLETGRQSTNTVVGHKYGEEARQLTDNITSAGSNVVLVYVDARGVMHRALVMKVGKSLGKGVVKARLKDGREVTLDESELNGQHTEKDEDGQLILVDDETHQQVQNMNQLGHSTAIEDTHQAITHRTPNPPPVPPRY